MTFTLPSLIMFAVATAFTVGVARRIPTDLAKFQATFDNTERLTIAGLWAAGLMSAIYSVPKLVAFFSSVQVVRGSGG